MFVLNRLVEDRTIHLIRTDVITEHDLSTELTCTTYVRSRYKSADTIYSDLPLLSCLAFT